MKHYQHCAFSPLTLIFLMIFFSCNKNDNIEEPKVTQISNIQLDKLINIGFNLEMVGKPVTESHLYPNQQSGVNIKISTQHIKFMVYVDKNGVPLDSSKVTSGATRILIVGQYSCSSSCSGPEHCGTLLGCDPTKLGCSSSSCSNCTVTCNKSSSAAAIGDINLTSL